MSGFRDMVGTAIAEVLAIREELECVIIDDPKEIHNLKDTDLPMKQKVYFDEVLEMKKIPNLQECHYTRNDIRQLEKENSQKGWKNKNKKKYF